MIQMYAYIALQALEVRKSERLTIEKNAQKVWDKVKLDAENSVKVLNADNGNLQNNLSLLKNKVVSHEESIVRYGSSHTDLPSDDLGLIVYTDGRNFPASGTYHSPKFYRKPRSESRSKISLT